MNNQPTVAVIGIVGHSQFLKTDHFHQHGETVTAEVVLEEMGGKGFNQAVAAARMGADVHFLAAVGNDAAVTLIRTAAQSDGITVHLSVKAEKRTTFAVILTDKHGDNRVTVCRGAELSTKDVKAFEPAIARSDVLLLQNEVPEAVNAAAIALANKHGTKVILNPAPSRPLPNEWLETLYAVTPNEQERQALPADLPCRCITTLGERGCLIDQTVVIEPLPVTAVDTTGAGDTFNGVLSVCVAQGMSLEDGCRMAVAASGLSVTKRGVLEAIPRKQEIETEINR